MEGGRGKRFRTRILSRASRELCALEQRHLRRDILFSSGITRAQIHSRYNSDASHSYTYTHARACASRLYTNIHTVYIARNAMRAVESFSVEREEITKASSSS